jgi:hypothetical protein
VRQEGGARVPGVVKGAVVDTTVSLLDTYPTHPAGPEPWISGGDAIDCDSITRHARSRRQLMRRTFKLTHPKIKVPRLVEAAKNDVRKYIKRERKKPLPKGVDYWDFACKFGASADEAQDIHVAELIKYIDQAEADEVDSFFVEVVSMPGHRKKKPRPDSDRADKPDKPDSPWPTESKAKE